ncbi:hypothetical protein Q3G72_026692 [Acer saccharum]|nr:hypothetical protein Q3G72_026692 [Acer saccharum]
MEWSDEWCKLQRYSLTLLETASKNKCLCVKCKVNEPVSGTSDDGRFCRECFRSNLYGKFKLAVTSNAMITPSYNLLVAFSSGSSSRVVLQFVHEMQQRAQKNFDASKDRSLPVFGVGVTFIDESAYHSVPSCEIDKAIEDIKSSAASKDVGSAKDSVTDSVVRGDVLLHLRMLSMQTSRYNVSRCIRSQYLLLQVASENGYNRLVLGLCTSRIACHVITATVKGQGYSLPADIQYVDARWEIPVVLPLRDCLAPELNMLCHLDGSDLLLAGQSRDCGIFKRSLFWYQWLGIIICETIAGSIINGTLLICSTPATASQSKELQQWQSQLLRQFQKAGPRLLPTYHIDNQVIAAADCCLKIDVLLFL